MPKKRNKENKGLPENWRYRRGAYFYRVPVHLRHLWDNKSEYLLGKTLIEANRKWAEKAEIYSDAVLIGELLDRYQSEIIPTKAATTQHREIPVIGLLKTAFSEMPIRLLKPLHVYKVRDIIKNKNGIHTANRAISLLSHAYTMAIEWGYCDSHPIKNNVVKYSTESRDRYIEDWELYEFLSVAGDLINAYVPFKQLTGRRKGEILAIKLTDLKDDGIHITKNKQRAGKKKKTIIIEWSDELREAVQAIRSLPRKVGSLYLFATRTGQPYIKENGRADGFNSIWNRKMQKALQETTLHARFSEHDIRAKTASDMAESEAIDLIDHSDPKLTKDVYRRKNKSVKPHTLKVKK